MTSAPDARDGRPEADERDAEAVAEGAAAEGDSGEEQAVEQDLDRLLEDVRRERDSYLDLARRAKADFENYRKRAARDTTEAERRGKASLAREILPAIDNLERALRSAGIEAGTEESAPAEAPSDEVSAHQALGRGVALVLGELQATLERAGVEAYDPVGERFDPSWHDALQTREVEGTESGTVVETIERGYRLDGQALRAARVVVSE